MPRVLFAGSIALTALVLFAFWPGYISKSPRAIDPYTHFHAIVASLWLLLLVAQPALLAARRLEWHRALGRMSWILAPGFAISAILLAHSRFSRMDDSTFVREAYSLYLPVSATLLFILSFSLAMAYRRTVQLHSRFFACTALLLVDPVCGRVLAFYLIDFPQMWHYQLVTFGIEIAVLALLLTTLAPGSRQRCVFSLFAAFYTGVLVVYFAATGSATWRGLADWFRQQPLT